MEKTKEQLYFLSFMKPFTDQGCVIEFNPTRIIMPDGTELYNEKENK